MASTILLRHTKLEIRRHKLRRTRRTRDQHARPLLKFLPMTCPSDDMASRSDETRQTVGYRSRILVALLFRFNVTELLHGANFAHDTSEVGNCPAWHPMARPGLYAKAPLGDRGKCLG
jgi:hypothetical protein